MNTEEAIAYLTQFATEERTNLFQRIAAERTRYLTVVLEDIYQSQNASAVVRTCDCFGIQDVHIIENRNTFQINREVALGSDKWLNLHYYHKSQDNTKKALTKLKKEGYRIVATTPHEHDVSLANFDLTKGKAALLFGGELNGLSDEAFDMADEFLKIPMVGFTESLNISVCAAIILHHLTNKLRSENFVAWNLSDEESNELILKWLKTSVRKADRILEVKYLQSIKPK